MKLQNVLRHLSLSICFGSFPSFTNPSHLNPSNHWYCRWPCLLCVCPLQVEPLAWTLLCWLFLQGELSQSLETVYISPLAKSLLNSLLQIKSSCFLLDIQQMHQIVSFLSLFSSLSCTDTLKKNEIVNNCKLVFHLRFYIFYSNDEALAYFII